MLCIAWCFGLGVLECVEDCLMVAHMCERYPLDWHSVAGRRASSLSLLG